MALASKGNLIWLQDLKREGCSLCDWQLNKNNLFFFFFKSIRSTTVKITSVLLLNLFQVPSSGQDCYANLKLKVPKAGSGRNSPAPSLNTGAPQIQYSDVTAIARTTEMEDSADILETTSLLSDLYASVDNKQNKPKTLDDTEDYANNVWGPGYMFQKLRYQWVIQQVVHLIYTRELGCWLNAVQESFTVQILLWFLV